MDKVAGEGLDLPSLDTLFLAVPISFKGRVVQQIGRITRSGRLPGGEAAPDRKEREPVVHDFFDEQVPWLARMHTKRRRVMLREGFRVAHDDGSSSEPSGSPMR